LFPTSDVPFPHETSPRWSDQRGLASFYDGFVPEPLELRLRLVRLEELERALFLPQDGRGLVQRVVRRLVERQREVQQLQILRGLDGVADCGALRLSGAFDRIGDPMDEIIRGGPC
jgi:hypothetical protein